MSDYTLHTVVVGSCDNHGEVAKAVQRFLERRYAAALARFAKARGEAAVLALWREALIAGKDIAGALWAAWSHPDLSEEAGKEMYGDIHMLSHQVGAAARFSAPDRLREALTEFVARTVARVRTTLEGILE
jgi:hypothetical protein